jgi:hypothetical protein
MDYTVEKAKEQSNSKSTESPPPVPESISLTWTPAQEKALVRRMDLRILPGLSLLYLLCFLDRT